jgi:hypothetical protein
MSGDPEQDYFADGMVEEIITALSRLRWLFVIARNSSFTYEGRAVDVKQVGRELGVRYVLEGSVRKTSNRVRITAAKPPISSVLSTLLTARKDALIAAGVSHEAPRIVYISVRLSCECREGRPQCQSGNYRHPHVHLLLLFFSSWLEIARSHRIKT